MRALAVVAVVAVLCAMAAVAFAAAPGMTSVRCEPIEIEGRAGKFCVMVQDDFDTFVRAYNAAGARALEAIKRAREAEDRCPLVRI